MHEVLTIQLGQAANFVGTHFWNAQNEYFEYGDSAQEPEFDHDILYRAGVNQRGIETYTPRVMIYDLKGGFGSLKKYNKLFQDDSVAQQDTWGQKVETFRSPEYPKNQYQRQLDLMDEGMETEPDAEMNLDESVHVWSDFNSNYFHPRSLNQINQYQMGNSLQPFDTYTAGYNAYDENEKETDSFDETFRFFVEECDQLQGFQIMTSIDDGFGGFTRGFLENVRDEYPKTSILTFGISNSNSPASMRNSQKISLNTSMAAAGISEYSSLYVPIHLPNASDINQSWARHLTINPSLPYHTSAILATAIETASVAWRMKKRSTRLTDMISTINWRGDSNIASLSICFPLDVGNGKQYKTVEQIMPKENGEFKLLKNLTIGKAKIENTVFGDSTIIRGISEKGGRLNREACVDSIFDYLRTTNVPSNLRITANTGVPLPVSFPKILSPEYVKHNISADDPSQTYTPALSQLSTGTQFFSYFEQYQQRLKGLNYRLFSDYEEGDRGQSVEDFAELKDWLIERADNFRPT
ncbi:mtDNA inheritance, partitioning of the mitochondrial organelle [Umbelopsis sp. WA50703]